MVVTNGGRPQVLLTPTAMGRSASRSRDGAASGGGGSGKDGNSKRTSDKFYIMASQPIYLPLT